MKNIDLGPYAYLRATGELLEAGAVKVPGPKKGETAEQRYNANREAIKEQQKRLDKALKKFDAQWNKSGKTGYDYAGTLSHVVDQLNSILEFLGS